MERLAMIDEVPFGCDPETMDVEKAQDDMSADACLQKIQNWERYREIWIEFYKQKLEEVNSVADKNIALQKHRLQDYFLTVPHRSTKTQEIYDLPSGKLTLRYENPKFVPDKTAIFERIQREGLKQYIRVKEELNWDMYKKNLSIIEGKAVDMTTGEIVDDVAVETPSPKFAITTNKNEEEMTNGEN